MDTNDSAIHSWLTIVRVLLGIVILATTAAAGKQY